MSTLDHHCTCGCNIDDHGHDDEFPGSTACTQCEDCIAYEWNGEREDPKPVKARKMAAKRARKAEKET